MSPHRSTATPVALAFALLVAYASLYPFAGWRWPAGARLSELLLLPWPPWRVPFDIWANLLGYVPLGALVAVARLRGGGAVPGAMAWALLSAAGLSYGMEFTQQFIPGRYPSALDWLLNSAGGLLGALLALVAAALGWLGHWSSLRDRWFVRDAGMGLALLATWPLGLLFPAPFPLGLGLGWERLQDWLIGWLVDVPWAQEALELISDIPVPIERPVAVVAGLGVLLGLLAPCLLVGVLTRPGWRRLLLCGLLMAVGLGATTLSAALNFGPGHALGWLGPEVLPAGVVAGVLLLPLAWLPARLAAALAVAALLALTMLVAQVPADPYFAVSLQAWEQGRFIHFHGLAQWLGWFWPYAALPWLLRRLAARA